MLQYNAETLWYLAVSAIQSLGELFELLIDSEGESVVSQGAESLYGISILHLLDHFTMF